MRIAAGGYEHMAKEAEQIGANTFAFFTRNPRGGSVKPFDKADADALNGFMQEHAFAPILGTFRSCAREVNSPFSSRYFTMFFADVMLMPEI